MISGQAIVDVVDLAERVGWTFRSKYVAATGSVYLDFCRSSCQETEWVQIRVADHKQVYQHWMVILSVAPGDLWFEELEGILTKPFGTVGDIL